MDNEEILEFLRQTGLLQYMTTKEANEKELKEYSEKQAEMAENSAKLSANGLKIVSENCPLTMISEN